MPLRDDPPAVHPSHLSIREMPGRCMVAAVCGDWEKAFAAALHKLRIAYYLPMYAKRIKVNGRGDTRDVQIPLFDGYVFLWGAPETIVTLRETPDARKHLWDVLHVADQAKLITALEGIHAALARDAHIAVGWQPKHGDKVRVSAGPFMGAEGRVSIEGPEKHLWTIIELLGAPRPIDIPADMLEAA